MMRTCERWDLLDGMDACEHEAKHRVTFDDGVRLVLCDEHAAELEDVAS